MKRLTQTLIGACLLVSLLLVLPGTASADLTLCPPGAGAGQCDNPQGLATNLETGHLYVADRDNNRVNVFEANGSFLFAFGWDVIPSGGAGDTGAGLEKCTTASTCQAGSEGAGAGQFAKPTRIAVDNSGGANQGDVYVGTDNFRIQHFAADGSFLNAFGWGVDTGAAELQSCTIASTCQAGISGAGTCQLTDFSEGDPLAVGPGGNVFVAVSPEISPGNRSDRVAKLDPSGACLGQTVLLEEGKLRLRRLAVDSAEDAYVSIAGAGGELRKYDLGAPETPLCTPDPGIETTAVAVDGSDNVYAAQSERRDKAIGSFRVITKYDSACNRLSRFGYGELSSVPLGLATYQSADGDVFASQESGAVKYLKLPPPGPIVAPPSLEASPVRSVWAAIKAEINPEGKASTYRVDYVEEESFETKGEWASPDVRSSGEASLGSSDFRLHGVEAIAGCKPFSEQALGEGKCLKPETTYRYRVIAKNSDGEDESEGELTTRPPMEFEETYASDVGIDAATLNVLFNPLGSEASGYFQYVEAAAYLKDKDEGGDGFASATALPDVPGGQDPLDFGSGEEALGVSIAAFPLKPGTTYRYRLLVTDPFTTLAGPTGAFTTFAQPEAGTCPANEGFRTGAAALLPDCRAYELVSPLDKSNGDIVALPGTFSRRPAVINQSAVSGGRLAYGSYRSFGGAESATYTTQYIAARVAGKGWESHPLVSARGRLISEIVKLESEFRAFSDDLCEAWQTPFADPPLSAEAIPAYNNIYRRTDELCGGAPDHEALTTVAPPNMKATEYTLELQGRSEDGSGALYVASDSLTADAPAQPPSCTSEGVGCSGQLYAKAPGEAPRFVCILPGGGASPDQCTAGTGPGLGAGETVSPNVTNAISADGKRVFWSALKGGNGTGQIYLRENPLGEGAECAEATSPCTIAVSKEGEALTPGSQTSRYWAAAADGSTAIFTNGKDLYEFEVETETTTKIAGGVFGVMGASEDATRVYFASSEAIAGSGQNDYGKEAVAGKGNLYLREAGPGLESYRFIATLAAADVDSGPQAGPSAVAVEPRLRSSKVSADGLHAAFMSEAPITGYDNTDVASPEECGKPKGTCDTEVFRYDAAADQLLCVSCNPSGARPVGQNAGSEGSPFWVAGQLPPFQNTLYAARVLAEDGSRLYFESSDALVLRDTNGRFDVYQWEAPGAGDCEEASATFSDAAGGCIDLISSGQSKHDSEFIDANPSGSDVFFATLSSLQPYDYGLRDIYDARAGGGLPPPPTPPPSCEGEACQAAYEPPIDQTPASASFSGPGSTAKGGAKPRRRCAKGKVKRRGRCVARQQRKAKRKASRRANHNRRQNR